jgi:glutamyl-tRNA reductase
MTIVSVRVSHELSTARLPAVPPDVLAPRLRELRRLPLVHESLLVSSPGRLEIFVVADSWTAAGDILETLEPATASRALCDAGPEALHHLFRLAANLDSAECGAHEMVDRLEDAASAAEAAGTLGPELRFAVNRASSVARGLLDLASRAAGAVQERVRPALVHKLLCNEVERIAGAEMRAHFRKQAHSFPRSAGRPAMPT